MHLRLRLIHHFGSPNTEETCGLIVLETARLPFDLSDELRHHKFEANIIQKSFEFFLESPDYFKADKSDKFRMPEGRQFGWTTVLD